MSAITIPEINDFECNCLSQNQKSKNQTSSIFIIGAFKEDFLCDLQGSKAKGSTTYSHHS